jgi:hypothetical protein
MSGSLRWLAALGLVGLPLLGSLAWGQNPTNPQPVRLAQPAPLPANTAVLGNAAQNPNFYNPYLAPPQAQAGPALANYALSTTPSFNPYLGGTAGMGPTPYGSGYSLSTSPYANLPNGGGLPGLGYGGYYPQNTIIPGYAASLMGYASLTSATGQYWKTMAEARVTREQYLQAQLDTARKRVEFERWLVATRPTATQMRAEEMATDLERARRDPPPTEIWSGQALNALLRSIQNSGGLNRGPNVPLDEDTLKNINLSARSSQGGIGMLKDGGKLNWPVSLQEAQFDEARKRLSKNLRRAVDQVKNDKEPVESALLKDINGDFKALNTKLNESADELSPAQYIEAKRYLNQLASGIKALSDPKVTNYFNNTWNAKGKNVAELVSNMTRDGLKFAPAAPGEEAAYNSLYQALRSFERGVQVSQR